MWASGPVVWTVGFFIFLVAVGFPSKGAGGVLYDLRCGLDRDRGEGPENGSRCVGGTSGWSRCGVAPFGGGSGSIRVGAASPACEVACTRMRVLLIGLSGCGEWSPVVGVCVATLFGCKRMPCGSYAAATILRVWWSHESVENAVLVSSIRRPLSHRDGGPGE